MANVGNEDNHVPQLENVYMGDHVFDDPPQTTQIDMRVFFSIFNSSHEISS